jgi:hypothetical protein
MLQKQDCIRIQVFSVPSSMIHGREISNARYGFKQSDQPDPEQAGQLFKAWYHPASGPLVQVYGRSACCRCFGGFRLKADFATIQANSVAETVLFVRVATFLMNV